MLPVRHSLAKDHVDRCNTWAALLIFLLAFVTLLLPLRPGLLSQAEPQAGRVSRPEVVSETVLAEFPRRYMARCFCPPVFTQSHVEYSETVCQGSFNFIAQGGNASQAPANLFELRLPDGPEPSVFGPEMVGTEKDKRLEVTKRDKKQQQKQQHQEEKHFDRAYQFLHVTTPVSIFLIAVCLLIPHFVWTLLTTLICGINVDQTLVSANEGSKLDHESRRQLHTELSETATEMGQAFTWRTSTLYLFFKILLCAVVISEAVVIYNSLVPQVRDLKEVYQHTDNDQSANYFSKDGDTFDAANNLKVNVDNLASSNKLLICFFPIRSFTNDRLQQVQCLFTPEELPVSTETEPSVATDSDTPRQYPTISYVNIYECLYLVLFTMLVALGVANMVSLLVWLMKLACRPCQKVDLPLDVYLLLQMARENAVMDFDRALSQVEFKQDDQGCKDIDLQE